MSVQVNVEPRSFEILPADMDIIDRVGKMARICYRSEPKDGEDERALNERIIRNCIQNGHESVLEHAAISVAIPVGPCADSTALIEKIDGVKGKRINLRGLWEKRITPVQAEYSIPFTDPDIETRHLKRLKLQDHRQMESAVPVILADVRAWRSIIDGKIQSSIAYDDPYAFILALAVLQACYDVAPVFFEDLVEKIEQFLAENGSDNKMKIFSALLNKRDANVKNLRDTINWAFVRPDDIFAEPAANCAMMSVIINADRAFTHQLVRHRRLVAYSQESQRYVNYNKKGFSAIELTVDPKRAGSGMIVDPCTGIVSHESTAYNVWKEAIDHAFDAYQKLVDMGVPTESARGVLPNDCRTTIGVSWLTPMGFNNLMHFRCEKHAQYAIRRLFQEILLTAITNDHPFVNIISFELTKEWMDEIKEQQTFVGDKDEALYKAAAAIVAKNQADAIKYFEELQKKREEMEKVAAEADKAAAEAREKDAKDSAPKIVDLSKAKEIPAEPEKVREAAPTVQFLKPSEKAPEESQIPPDEIVPPAEKIVFPPENLKLMLADSTFVFHDGENLDTVKEATVDFINSELEAPFRGACKDRIVEKVRELVHADPDYTILVEELPWADGQTLVEYKVIIGANAVPAPAPQPTRIEPPEEVSRK